MAPQLARPVAGCAQWHWHGAHGGRTAWPLMVLDFGGVLKAPDLTFRTCTGPAVSAATVTVSDSPDSRCLSDHSGHRGPSS
jgi:hypothetical protein